MILNVWIIGSDHSSIFVDFLEALWGVIIDGGLRVFYVLHQTLLGCTTSFLCRFLPFHEKIYLRKSYFLLMQNPIHIISMVLKLIPECFIIQSACLFNFSKSELNVIKSVIDCLFLIKDIFQKDNGSFMVMQFLNCLDELLLMFDTLLNTGRD